MQLRSPGVLCIGSAVVRRAAGRPRSRFHHRRQIRNGSQKRCWRVQDTKSLWGKAKY